MRVNELKLEDCSILYDLRPGKQDYQTFDLFGEVRRNPLSCMIWILVGMLIEFRMSAFFRLRLWLNHPQLWSLVIFPNQGF